MTSVKSMENPNLLLKWLSYPRSILILFLLPTWTGLIATIVVILAFLPGGSRFADGFATIWSRLFLKVSGLDIEVRGRENFPESGGLMLFNHTSNFDIFLMMGLFKKRKIKFGAKAELFKIPIFSRAMRVVGALPIERKNREKVLQIYKQASQRMKNGETFALAPEGTRSKTYDLQPFRNGPFLFAIGAQGPLIPLVIAGALPIMPSGSPWVNWGVWKRKVILHVLPCISTEGYNEDNVRELRDKVYQEMSASYEQLKIEIGLSN